MTLISQVIQTDAMGQLCVNQTDHVTPRLEGSRLILGSGLPRYFETSWGGIKLQICRKMLN